MRFEEDSTLHDLVELHLEHYNVQKAPSYSALSYVWDGPEKRSSITVNTRKFRVTEILLVALLHVKIPTRVSVVERLGWFSGRGVSRALSRQGSQY